MKRRVYCIGGPHDGAWTETEHGKFTLPVILEGEEIAKWHAIYEIGDNDRAHYKGGFIGDSGNPTKKSQ